MNITKLAVGVALGLVAGVILLSALPSIGFGVGFLSGLVWHSGILPVVVMVLIVIGGIAYAKWRDAQLDRMRGLKGGDRPDPSERHEAQ